jgi:hypothetical protein
VGCFRCGDCGMVLREGYFDVNGQAYCERDALRRVQPSAPAAPPMAPPVQASGYQVPVAPRKQSFPKVGLPSGPMSQRSNGSLSRPFGMPSGNRLAPGQALGRGGLGLPRMEKRMTRLGMMGPA